MRARNQFPFSTLSFPLIPLLLLPQHSLPLGRKRKKRLLICTYLCTFRNPLVLFSLHIVQPMHGEALPTPHWGYYMYILYVYICFEACVPFLLWVLRRKKNSVSEKRFGSRLDSKSSVEIEREMNSPRSLCELGNSLVFRAAPNQLAFNSLFLFRGVKPLTSFASIKAVGGFFERIYVRWGLGHTYTPPSVWFPHLLQISQFFCKRIQKKK